jgi:hypothetical protein
VFSLEITERRRYGINEHHGPGRIVTALLYGSILWYMKRLDDATNVTSIVQDSCSCISCYSRCTSTPAVHVRDVIAGQMQKSKRMPGLMLRESCMQCAFQVKDIREEF